MIELLCEASRQFPPPHVPNQPSSPSACLEHVCVELLLQALVGQVDAQLLKGVEVK